MARVIPIDEPEWVLGLTTNPLIDAQTICRIIGGTMETVELDNNTALIVNSELVDDGSDDVPLNHVASDLLFRIYRTVMPVIGTAILVDLDDFGLSRVL